MTAHGKLCGLAYMLAVSLENHSHDDSRQTLYDRRLHYRRLVYFTMVMPLRPQHNLLYPHRHCQMP
jgi:hypothetical protein